MSTFNYLARGHLFCLKVVCPLCRSKQLPVQHRRRIKTEEKANVVAAVWGEEFIKFLAALAVLPRTFSFHPDVIHPIIQNLPMQNS